MNRIALNCASGRLFMIVAALLICAVAAQAYSFMPLVTSCAAQDSKCATQAWDATQDADGIMYFGTTDGLLTFDGVRWEAFDLPGIHTVRSVLAVGRRVYVGAYQQFGYIERDVCGLPVYHSLTDSVPGLDFHDDEFWNIVPHGSDIYFQSFRSVYRYDGSTIKIFHDPDQAPLYLFNHHDRLFTQLIYKGLAEMDDDTYRPYIARSALGNADVVAMLDCGDTLLLCTESAGIFQLKESSQSPLPFTTAIDRQLRDCSINRAIRMADGTIVIGTIRNGIYAIGPDGAVKWHYNIDNRLGNNSILGLTEDSAGNLWVMMDHGISVVHSGLPYTFLMPHAGEPYIGMTYAMHRDGDNLYIGTNQGLYTYSLTDRTIREADRLHSQIWHIHPLGNSILVGGGTMSALIGKDGSVATSTDNSTDLKKGVIHNREVLVESSYYSLRIYMRNPDGNWAYSHDIDGFGAPIRQVEFDTDGSLWCSHLAQGIIHIELSPDLRSVAATERFGKLSPHSRHAASFVMKIRGNIAVSDGDSLYRYDHSTHTFEPMHHFMHDLPALNGIYSITPVDDRMFWISSRRSYSLISFDDGHYRCNLSIPLDDLSLQSNGVNNNVYVDSDRNCYFAINNGVGCLNLASADLQHAAVSMSIAAVEHVSGDGLVQRLPLVSPDDNPVSASGNISFRLRYPAFNLGVRKFTYTLHGPENISGTSDEPQVHFVGLSHGHYTFSASMTDDNGHTLATSQYQFIVPTPGYLSYWAMGGYTIVLAAVTFACSKLYSRRQVNIQRRRHEIETVAQNLKILEQERIISDQQKQLLEHQLSVKGKELASMALEASFKHQVIENLRETITARRNKGVIASQEVDSLIKTINSDIGSSEFWNIFQTNFDLIHENFFRNLRKQYPELTATDLKFCGLLRLNMSTKDIAKFTALTVRGVETARYRLRRKLGLDSNQSIVQFLIDFK